MEIIISEVLKNLRKNKGVSQEVIAETMGISVQAVSKWENNLSYPDIELLPKLSEYYNVSIDYLLTGNEKTSKNEHEEIHMDNIPDDDILRIVQYKGNQMLTKNTYDKSKRIMLEITDSNINQVEIWGSADIKGDIGGNVNVGDGINCGNVGLSITAGDGVNCGNVGGDIIAGDGVNCGNVGGNITSQDGVNCGDIRGAVAAGDEVKCGNIKGNVIVGDSLKCANIEGDIQKCEGDIHCSNIKGDVHCEGDIYYKDR